MKKKTNHLFYPLKTTPIMVKAFLVAALLTLSLAGMAQSGNPPATQPVADSVSASFPGGNAGWQQFLNKNLRFPEEAINKVTRRKPRQWDVIINFMVTKEGKLKNFNPETNFGLGLEDEAIRVLKKSPLWEPAKLKGVPVDSYIRQPVIFRAEVAR